MIAGFFFDQLVVSPFADLYRQFAECGRKSVPVKPEKLARYGVPGHVVAALQALSDGSYQKNAKITAAFLLEVFRHHELRCRQTLEVWFQSKGGLSSEELRTIAQLVRSMDRSAANQKDEPLAA